MTGSDKEDKGKEVFKDTVTGSKNELIDRSESLMIRADGSKSEREEKLLREHELSIIVNDRPVMRLVCTRDNLYELVLGRLKTEGFIDKAEDVFRIWFCRYENEATVLLNKEIMFEEGRNKELSCCTGNKSFLLRKDGIKPEKLPAVEWKEEWIFALAGRFAEGMYLHNITGSTHSCILARGDEILFACEDIGRHNAVDKAVGYALKEGIPLSQCIIYTSGRVPVDMAEKVITAGIPVLVSKSLPTADAVELAGEYGLTIIGGARPDSMRVYGEAGQRMS